MFNKNAFEKKWARIVQNNVNIMLLYVWEKQEITKRSYIYLAFYKET